MRAVVVLGGTITDSPLVRRALDAAELIIAADSGVERLRALGIQPTVAVGDFDSIGQQGLDRLRAAGVEIALHPDPGNKTDGHAALLLAQARGAATVHLLGVRGGPRIDHSLGNVMVASAAEFAALEIWIVDGWSEATPLRGDGHNRVEFRGEAGDYVSLIALTDEVRGVTTHGLVWPLQDATLTRGGSLGVSNELAGPAGGYRMAAGVALATHFQRDAAGGAGSVR